MKGHSKGHLLLYPNVNLENFQQKKYISRNLSSNLPSIARESNLCVTLKVKVKAAQPCLTLCGPMDYRVHGILQARILECVAFPFSRGSSQPRDRTQVSRIAGGFFISWATREAQKYSIGYPIASPVALPDPVVKPGTPALQVDSLPAELPGKSLLCRAL